MRYAYSVVNGVRVENPAPPKQPTVRWRRKGCPNCKPIVVPTRPTNINPFTSKLN